MMTDTFRESKPGINIKFRTDGKLFNPMRLQAATKVKYTVLRDFLFTDDCALNASDEQEMQAEMDSFSAAATTWASPSALKRSR